jgi:hypothetical protein
MSLALLNEGRDVDPQYVDLLQQTWGPVRICTAAAHRYGDDVLLPLYTALGRRRHLDRAEWNTATFTAALADVGLATELVDAATSTDVDDALRASHQEAIDQVGMDVGTPVIAVGDTAFFGPVVTPAPTGEAAGQLWDGMLLVAGTPGFYELKRTRDSAPVFD